MDILNPLITHYGKFLLVLLMAFSLFVTDFVMSLKQSITLGKWARRVVISSMVIVIVPIFTLCLFHIVFVWAGSSNVAQIARFGGERGYAFWQLWVSFWVLLLLLNPLSAIFFAFSLFLPPYSMNRWALYFSRLFARLTACTGSLVACQILLTFFPDA